MKTEIPYISELRIKNFKSYKNAIINLKPFSVLVGPNASGKTNLVDALAFISDAVYRRLDFAVDERGGVYGILNRTPFLMADSELGFGVKIDFGTIKYDYSFELIIPEIINNIFHVRRERLIDINNRNIIFDINYDNNSESVKSGIEGLSEIADPKRLALGVLGTKDVLSPVYEFLSAMRRYVIDPNVMFREKIIGREEGNKLNTDGSNSGTVLLNLAEENGKRYEELCEILSLILPLKIKPTFGYTEAHFEDDLKEPVLLFIQTFGDKGHREFFDTKDLSEGTIRALGILLSIYQPDIPPVVIIEHPEDAIHPAAFEVLVDVLKSGTDRAQVIITTHSADILDDKDIKDDEIICVVNEDGVSYAGPVDDITRGIIRDSLTTPGELLRTDRLNIDRASTEIDDSDDFLFAGFDG